MKNNPDCVNDLYVKTPNLSVARQHSSPFNTCGAAGLHAFRQKIPSNSRGCLVDSWALREPPIWHSGCFSCIQEENESEGTLNLSHDSGHSLPCLVAFSDSFLKRRHSSG